RGRPILVAAVYRVARFCRRPIRKRVPLWQERSVQPDVLGPLSRNKASRSLAQGVPKTQDRPAHPTATATADLDSPARSAYFFSICPHQEGTVMQLTQKISPWRRRAGRAGARRLHGCPEVRLRQGGFHGGVPRAEVQ